MISTIGSLVQEASNRRRWLLAASIYTLGCVSTATLLGAALGALGRLLGHLLRGLSIPWGGAWLVGLLAIAYAASDVGMIALPRPTLMHAVPITWWRWWRPYGAALAYGAALGLGVTTSIAFGAFYVLCASCVLKGDSAYGALLMGAYGAARALVIFPASWGVSCHRGAMTAWLCSSPLFDLERAQRVVAATLMMFGAQILVSTVFTAPPLP
jgi:Cytochrome C biogenesis protein transmembrane region